MISVYWSPAFDAPYRVELDGDAVYWVESPVRFGLVVEFCTRTGALLHKSEGITEAQERISYVISESFRMLATKVSNGEIMIDAPLPNFLLAKSSR